MALSNEGKRLLNDIFSASLKSPDGVDSLRFRVDNEQFISEIDQLERLGYIQRRNDLYSITLLALAKLAKENREAQILVHMCNLVFALLRGAYKDDPRQSVTAPNISKNTGLSEDDVETALRIIIQTSILASYTHHLSGEKAHVTPSENVLKYKSFEDILKEREEWEKHRNDQSRESAKLLSKGLKHPVEQEVSLSATSSSTTWKAIKSEYGETKRSFGKKINFVLDSHKRKIIFSDVEHSFVLAYLGFSKPAVILAGSVIEELLRLYLEYKNIKPKSDNFDDYIEACKQPRLLKSAVASLSDSVRHFRNLVHLSREKTKKHSISRSTAKTAVASIFTIANDF